MEGTTSSYEKDKLKERSWLSCALWDLVGLFDVVCHPAWIAISWTWVWLGCFQIFQASPNSPVVWRSSRRNLNYQENDFAAFAGVSCTLKRQILSGFWYVLIQHGRWVAHLKWKLGKWRTAWTMPCAPHAWCLRAHEVPPPEVWDGFSHQLDDHPRSPNVFRSGECPLVN